MVLLIFLDRLSDTKVHVRIVNDLSNGVDLNVHCKSKDDDLGVHQLHSNENFEFRFGQQFFGASLFFYRFWWGSTGHWFDIYDDDRDQTRCYERCWWLVKETGPFLLNRDTCEYYSLLGLHPLLNTPGARAGPLPGPPHEAAQGNPLY